MFITILLLSYLSLLYLLAVSNFSFSLLKRLNIICLRILLLNFVYILNINKKILLVINNKEKEILNYRSLLIVKLVSKDLKDAIKLVYLIIKLLKC